MAVLIQNGRVVTPERTFAADVLVRDGKIAAVGPGLPPTGAKTYDAAGCLVFPGFIDAHTHLDMDNGVTATADDFATGTRAAVCGGTTTVVDFATQDKGGTLARALEAWHKKADGKSSCDYAFHMAITDWNPAVAEEIGEMVKAGVTSFKLYLAYDNLRVTDAELYEILKRVGQAHGIIGTHCENGDLVNEKVAELPRGRKARAAVSRPFPARLCRGGGDRALLLHRRGGGGAGPHRPPEHPRGARGGAGAPARADRRSTSRPCPQYLVLDGSRYDAPGFKGAKYVCSPPLRSLDDQAALWEAIRNGEIDSISTDHCSYNYAGQKDLGQNDFSKIPNGLPGIEHRPAAVYTAGSPPGG